MVAANKSTKKPLHRSGQLPKSDEASLQSNKVAHSGRGRSVGRKNENPYPEIEFSRDKPNKKVVTRRLFSIKRDAKLIIPQHVAEGSYALLSNELDGVDSKFNDEDYSEAVRLGLDFGTSTLKAVVHTESYEHCLAIPFRDLNGIDAYLLPTILYQRSDGSYCLEPTEKLAHASLKLALMEDSTNNTLRTLTVAFLALAIRHVRAWLYSHYPDEFDNALISWEIRLGCPSDSDQSEIITLWHDLLVRAWLLSEKSGYITRELLSEVMSPKEIDPGKLVSDYCRAYPEVYAAAIGFRKVYPPEASYLTDIIMVDIGSGTLDISSFALSDRWSDHRISVIPFCSKVEHLGTSKCFEVQLNYLKNILLSAKRKFSFPINQKRLNHFINNLVDEKGQALREPLKNLFSDYSYGLEFYTPKNLTSTPENRFANSVRQQLLRVRKGTRETGYLLPTEVSNMEIILTGGGSRSKFYDRAFKYDNGSMYRSFEWLSPKHMKFRRIDDIPDIRNELERPISSTDYDRLLVAYGLQVEELADSRTTVKAKPLHKKDYQAHFIEKSMV